MVHTPNKLVGRSAERGERFLYHLWICHDAPMCVCSLERRKIEAPVQKV